MDFLFCCFIPFVIIAAISSVKLQFLFNQNQHLKDFFFNKDTAYPLTHFIEKQSGISILTKNAFLKNICIRIIICQIRGSILNKLLLTLSRYLLKIRIWHLITLITGSHSENSATKMLFSVSSFTSR